MTEELLTVAQVAEILQLNQQTVRNWLTRGELPAVRVGPRRIRIRKSDVDAVLGRRAPAEPISAPGADQGVIEALRDFSRAASKLADALERGQKSS